jgi:outer membrane protein OmpA-like peptidoglycan-associated protein
MKNKYAYGVLLSFVVLVMSGCGARSDPFFGKHIRAADQAIEEARNRGAEKGDLSKFQAAVKLRDDAEQTYMACNYYQAKQMTSQVVQMASLLNGPVRVVERKPPVIVKAPVVVPVPVKTSVQKIQELQPVLFEFDKSRIDEKFHPVLDTVASIMKSDSSLQMGIHGHTDGMGPEKYNQVLSEARANAIADYLIKRGVPSGRFAVKGFGLHEPVGTNKTKEGRAQNRRAHFLPLKK